MHQIFINSSHRSCLPGIERMAFIENYKHDLFVSFAHVDNEPLPGVEQGWVSNLVRCLKTKLGQKLGRSDAFNLWMDYRLAGNMDLTSQILQALENTAIILIVLSPGYIASEWCSRERETFMRLVKKRVSGGSRIFVVERDKVEESQKPEEIRDLLGYRFWVIDQEGAPPRILGEPKPDPSDPRYYDRFTDLCVDIADELYRLKELEKGDSSAVVFPKGNYAATVFLAEVTDDLEDERDEVRRYLIEKNVRVLPENLYSRNPGQFRASVEKDLKDCSVYVQLLSKVRGKVALPEEKSFSEIQFECARDKGKRILQWRGRDVAVEMISNEGYRNLVTGKYVMAVSLEEFKSAVVRCALEKPKASPADRQGTFVFVDRDTTDASIADTVCEYLDRCGAEYVLPLDQGKPSEIRQDLEENLLDCDSVIVVYGLITVAWVREQLRQCRKILAKRTRPIKAFAVFEGPPETKIPLGLKLANMQIINCRTGVRENDIMEFVNAD
jgi:hypothetical protein